MIASSRAGEALADRRLKESENASTVFSWTPLAVVCSSTYASVLMPRETASERAARTRKIIGGLSRAYPDAHCELNFSSPLELLVATILSAQSTDKRVNLVTADLFRKYRTAEDYARARPAELEQAIKTAGFYRNKARSLQACCRALLEKHRGEVPRTMEALVELGVDFAGEENIKACKARGQQDAHHRAEHQHHPVPQRPRVHHSSRRRQ